MFTITVCMLLDNWENWMSFSSCGLSDMEQGWAFPKSSPRKNVNYYLLTKRIPMWFLVKDAR